MTESKIKSLADGEEIEPERIGAELMTQVIRVLKVVTAHSLDNQTAQQVCREFRHFTNEMFGQFSQIQIQCVSNNVYFNGTFIKLKGGAFDSAIQTRRLFKRLGISSISFLKRLDEATAHAFFLRFQECMLGQEPEQFAKSVFKSIKVRPISETHEIGVDRRMELARCYAQLVVLFQESCSLLEAHKRIPLAQLRRALQHLVQVAEGQEALLAGLTRFENPEGDIGIHSVAVSALSVLMGLRLGMTRKQLISLGLGALFHKIGTIEVAEPQADVKDAEQHKASALQTILMISRFTGSAEALQRTSLAYEHGLGAAGDGSGVIPTTGARIVAVASCFDSMTHPKPPARGLKPDQAIRLMLEHSGGHFDRRVLKLFTSVIGLYPIGSVVEVSGDRTGIVISVPDDPTKISRPLVKIIREKDAPADYLLELEKERDAIRVLGVLDAREQQVNVTHFLLA